MSGVIASEMCAVLLPYVSTHTHTHTHTGCAHSSENSKRCQQAATTRVVLHSSSCPTHQANPTGQAEGKNWEHIDSSWGHPRSRTDSGRGTNISCGGTPHDCQELHGTSPPGSMISSFIPHPNFHHFKAPSLYFATVEANTILVVWVGRCLING